jgi:hypothetical protein
MRRLKRKIALRRSSAVAAALGALVIGGASAQAATELPQVHKSGRVEYMSGGVGKDAAMAIEQASRKWPLTLEFTVKDGKRDEFTADVKVVVRDARGREALQATADGPFLLAKLAPGHYDVDATLGSKTLHEKVSVKQGQPAKAVFVWPAGTSERHS